MVKKRSRMGRPVKAAKDKRSGKVMLRLTPSEQRRLAAEAKEAGLRLASFIHKRVTESED